MISLMILLTVAVKPEKSTYLFIEPKTVNARCNKTSGITTEVIIKVKLPLAKTSDGLRYAELPPEATTNVSIMGDIISISFDRFSKRFLVISIH